MTSSTEPNGPMARPGTNLKRVQAPGSMSSPPGRVFFLPPAARLLFVLPPFVAYSPPRLFGVALFLRDKSFEARPYFVRYGVGCQVYGLLDPLRTAQTDYGRDHARVPHGELQGGCSQRDIILRADLGRHTADRFDQFLGGILIGIAGVGVRSFG